MARAIVGPYLLILTLTLVAILQATSPCRKEICLWLIDILANEVVTFEPREYHTNRTRLRGSSTAAGRDEVSYLSECQCESEKSCVRKCCSAESVLDRKTGKCMEAEISFYTRDTPQESSKVTHPNNGTSGVSCFSKCAPGKKLFISVLDEKNTSSLILKSGEFCTYYENNSVCLKSDEFCIDYVSLFPRVLAFALCQNVTSANDKTPTWKGYNYPSPVMPLMIGVMLIISSLSLSVTFFVYSYFRDLRNLHGKCLLCHIGSLVIYYVIIIVRRFRSAEMRHDGSSCFALDVARYYFYLTPFSWLNVICFDISMSFINLRPTHVNLRRSERTKLAFYSLYAWVLPVAALYLSLHIDLNSKGLSFSDINLNKWCKEKHFSSSNFRYIPMSLFMGLSVFLFVATAMKIYRINNSTSILRSGENTRQNVADENKKRRFKLYAKLLVVMGFMSWVMEPIFWTVHEWMVADRTDFRSTVWFVMLVIRNLQGLYISVVFLWNDKVRVLMKKMRTGAASGSSGSRSHEMSNISRSESSMQITANPPNSMVPDANC